MTGRPGRAHLQSKLTTTSAVLMAVGFAVVGGVLLWISGIHGLDHHRVAGAFFAQLGGLLVATGVFTIAWDLFGRRALADEVLAKARLSTDVVEAGLVRVTDQYLEEVEWADLFRDVHRLDIFVAYASTWRNTHQSRLHDVAQRADARIRVFLPDPDDEMTMTVLADRFDTTVDDLAHKVREAIREFDGLRQPGGATVEVYLRKGDLVFTFYRFDSRAVLTLYSHGRKRRTQVPTFVVESGDLFKFIHEEIQSLAEQSTLMPREA